MIPISRRNIMVGGAGALVIASIPLPAFAELEAELVHKDERVAGFLIGDGEHVAIRRTAAGPLVWTRRSKLFGDVFLITLPREICHAGPDWAVTYGWAPEEVGVFPKLVSGPKHVKVDLRWPTDTALVMGSYSGNPEGVDEALCWAASKGLRVCEESIGV